MCDMLVGNVWETKGNVLGGRLEIPTNKKHIVNMFNKIV